MQAAKQPQRIEAYVRDVLGCACPAELFENILVSGKTTRIGVCRYQLRKILIGGRLLLYLVAAASKDLLPGELAALLDGGRKERDAGGYKRFRLVLFSAGPADDASSLNQVFNEQAAGDDRLHLHVQTEDEFDHLL